jgi:hypothetical protein
MKETKTKDRVTTKDYYFTEIPFFQVPNELFTRTDNIYEGFLLTYLFRCANNADRVAFPSYSDMAKKCHISKRKAIYTIRALVTKGFIEKVITRVEHGKEFSSNLYTLSVEGSAQHAPPSAQHAPPLVHSMHPKKNHLKKNYLNNKIDKIPLSDKLPPPRDPEVVKRLAMEPHARVYRDVDKETELIPLENIGHKLPGSIKDVLGKIKGDIEDQRAARNKAPQALKSKSRARKR